MELKKEHKNRCALNPTFSHLPSIKGTCSSHYALLPPHNNLPKRELGLGAMGVGGKEEKEGKEGKEEMDGQQDVKLLTSPWLVPQKCTQVGVGER